MNYKLTQQFKELKERNGFIENNSTGKVQIVISNDGTVPNELSKSAIIIDVNSKYKYSLKSSEKIYARSLNRLVAWVNVFEFSLSGDGSFDLANYYTKNEIDSGYVKKNDNIDGSKVNKMTGYVKANSYTQIVPTDSLVVALSKLEKRTDDLGSLSTPTSRKVIAGQGLSGGGALTGDITVNVATADDGLVINADNIKLNIVDNMTTDSNTRPVSAKQVKLLNETKLNKTDNIDGNKINKLTGYAKAGEKQPILPTDSLIVALGKLEKGLESASPAMEVARSRSIGSFFKFYYCTKSEYDTLDKMRDDSTIYLILDEITGNVDMKVYRP